MATAQHCSHQCASTHKSVPPLLLRSLHHQIGQPADQTREREFKFPPRALRWLTLHDLATGKWQQLSNEVTKIAAPRAQGNERLARDRRLGTSDGALLSVRSIVGRPPLASETTDLPTTTYMAGKNPCPPQP